MFDLFRKKAISLHSVEVLYKKTIALGSRNAIRSKVEIVAIDDNEFHPETNLRNSGFNIRSLKDINLISDVEPFSIVLCDVSGIGVSLSADTQGAYVIEEIKSAYPEKIVIAYTAGSVLSKIVQRAKAAADFDLKKDASIEDWRDLLDNCIGQLTNPIEAWKNLRIRLLSKGIELEELMRLEQIVLRNVGGSSAETKEALIKELAKDKGGSPWKSEFGKFLGSKAFDVAFTLAASSVAT
ncbi:hypothetical protein HX836_11875 [Pseudomonas yamanorum]|jgi:hypothetical protein|uniref:hypothetical protein n=1 Tax=Pseudomonas yamanorum TaxID=515393 RepID=UPI00159FB027|nr:hypothetical protein [Pseudomonas yamanorum]NVZ82499.1 hypothetical protein [Pseudomonas yamanorum]